MRSDSRCALLSIAAFSCTWGCSLMWRAGEQVTKVGRGQKLGDNAEAVPFSDMTVEDLLRIVRSLPPEESAVAAVSRGLFYLDSRALAALLKELHKVGLSNRCAPNTCPEASMSAVTCAPRHSSWLRDEAEVPHRRRWTRDCEGIACRHV